MSLENLKTLETITLDFYNNNIKTINVKQLDMKSRYVKISCTEHGKAITLNPETMSAFVRCKKPDGFSVLNDCAISPDGTLLLELTQQMLAVTGKCTVDIMLYYTNLIEGNEDGNVELSEKGVALNGLTVTDDNAGNVNVSVDENSDFTVQKYTADVIEAIYKLNVPVLSTMTFYLNVLPTAIDHTEIESSYEYDALIQGLKNQELIEKHMKALDKTLNKHEEDRQDAESKRESAETAREKSESVRNTAEQQRIDNEKSRQSIESARQSAEENREAAETQRDTNEVQRQINEASRTSAEGSRNVAENARITSEEQRATNEFVRQENEALRVAAETTRETNTSNAITACTTATTNAVQATTDTIAATNSANDVILNIIANIIPSATAATDNANTAASVANSAATEANSATDAANAATAKCQEIIDSRDIANNLTTETEGMVLDATQGKILYEMIQVLQEEVANMHAVHYGTGEPDDSLGKDGDIYMMIIEEGE